MNEKLSALIKHRATLPVAVGVLAFGSGLAAGYFLGRREKAPTSIKADITSATEEYQAGLERVREQLAETRAARPPRVIVDVEALAKVEERGATVDEVVLDEPTETVIEPIVEEPEAEVTVNGEPVRRTTFIAEEDDEWDMAKELRTRTPERPYVVHREEFFEETEEEHYRQRTLTYYNGDDVLVDEDNSPIYNYVQVVGEMKFGHGSGDPNVVYVRNEKLKAEYEIVLDSGLYSVEVLGHDIEDNQRAQRRDRDIQHSAVKRFPRE